MKARRSENWVCINTVYLYVRMYIVSIQILTQTKQFGINSCAYILIRIQLTLYINLSSHSKYVHLAFSIHLDTISLTKTYLETHANVQHTHFIVLRWILCNCTGFSKLCPNYACWSIDGKMLYAMYAFVQWNKMFYSLIR